jgi:AcrR family transcriptional regulator
MTSALVKTVTQDKRVQRTRQALFDAFFALVLERPYDEIKIGDIVTRAGIGRSTLYEHFPNKAAILAASLSGLFALLADAVGKEHNAARLVRVLEHFWGNRALARGMFADPLRRRTITVLVRLIEQRLKTEGFCKPNGLIIPPRMAAIQIAEALLAPITVWLTAESSCSANVLALALRTTATALVGALRR